MTFGEETETEPGARGEQAIVRSRMARDKDGAEGKFAGKRIWVAKKNMF